MNDKELDIFLKKHLKDIEKFSKMHCKYYNYEDFYRELLYDVYVHMKEYYRPEIQNNPSVFFYSVVGFLAKGVYRKMVNESAKEHRANKLIMENTNFDAQGISKMTIEDILALDLTETERQIIVSIDYFCSFDKFSYKKVADKLGIEPRLLYYYVYNIRKKVKEALESNKT